MRWSAKHRGAIDDSQRSSISLSRIAFWSWRSRCCLFVWGAISFHQLPVEAYPDVANNYVEIITQWPGISAEQIEQQVTIPLEIVMNGIPGVVHLRSFSIFGLSDLKLIFDDDTDNGWNRERVLERLAQVTLPPGVSPQMGTDWSPVGQIYFFTLRSTNPQYDVMELKSIEDWVVEKNLKSVPDIVDVATFGGPTREYQVRVDPNKLISYGLSLAQVEQQLTNNNVNAGGSFLEAGLQQINVREVGLVKNVHDIENTVLMTKSGTPLRVKDIAVVAQGPKIRLGQFARAIRREDGKIIDNDDVVSGLGAHAQGRGCGSRPPGTPRQSGGTERSHPAAGSENRSLHRPQRSGALYDAHGPAQPHRGHHPGGDHSVAVSRAMSGEPIIVALTIPFSLLFAATCLKLKGIPANLLSLGALDFGMVVDGAVVMVENIVRHLSRRTEDATELPEQKIFEAAHEVQRPVFYAIGIIITAYLPIFTLQRVEGRLFKPMAWTVAFALLGALLFSMLVAPVLASFFFPKGTREWHNPVMTWLTARYRGAAESGRSGCAGSPSPEASPAWPWRSTCGSGARSAPSFCRTWMKARCGCAALWRPAPDRPKASGWRIRRGFCCALFPRSPSAPARWAVPTTERTRPAFSTPNTSST